MKKMILIIFLLFPMLIFSQKEGNVWVMGYGDGTDSLFTTFTIDFNFDPPQLERRFQDYSIGFTSTTICDSSGQLILYSNGVDLKNGFDEIVINGEEFQPSASYSLGFPVNQAGLILPRPENETYFFLLGDAFFFNDANTGALTVGTNPLTYSIIGELEDGNQGEVFFKKEILLGDTLEQGQLTATKHSNGRDWWILGKKFNSNEFFKVLLSNSGIGDIEFFTVGDSTISGLGQSAFSPNGKWYAKNSFYGSFNGTINNGFNEVSIYQFDRCEGVLTNHVHEILPVTAFRSGIAFSPNSELLYASTHDTIFQYDLTSNNILASRQVVAVYDGFVEEYNGIELFIRFNKMQLAPNGKIYISTPPNSRYLHVINQPNELGVACNVLQHELELPAFNNRSLPNLPNSSASMPKSAAPATLSVLSPNSPTSPMPSKSHSKMKAKEHLQNGNGHLATEEAVPSNILCIFIILRGRMKYVWWCRMKQEVIPLVSRWK